MRQSYVTGRHSSRGFVLFSEKSVDVHGRLAPWRQEMPTEEEKMTYPINPNPALLTWCLRHGLWAQRLDASTPGPAASNGTVRSPSQGSFPVASVVGEESTPVAYRAQAGDDSPRVLVVCESERGRTGSAADAIATAAARHGADALTGTIDDTPPARVAQADAVILGCWAPGKVPFGDEPARRLADWIETLPNLDGKPVGVFCVYRFFPHTFADMATRVAETERNLVGRLERKGARVASKRAIHFKSINANAAELAEGVLECVRAA